MTKVSNTPWGSVQGQDILADGIIQVYTAGHGGIVLSDSRQRQLLKKGVAPKSNWLGSNKYWEEDCDWAVPFFHFSNDIKAFGTIPADQFELTFKAAKKTIEHYNK